MITFQSGTSADWEPASQWDEHHKPALVEYKWPWLENTVRFVIIGIYIALAGHLPEILLWLRLDPS